MLHHTVTVTAQWNFKVISPHDDMMAKCFQHDNFCHMLISVYVCSSGILKTEMYQPGNGSTQSAMCTECALDPFSGKRRMMVTFSIISNMDLC